MRSQGEDLLEKTLNVFPDAAAMFDSLSVYPELQAIVREIAGDLARGSMSPALRAYTDFLALCPHDIAPGNLMVLYDTFARNCDNRATTSPRKAKEGAGVYGEPSV